ncbi:MAG: hypothetical protein ACFBWO_04885 [Paracoccaceae bacterium]
MLKTLRLTAVLALLAGPAALAQSVDQGADERADREALARALASVNEPDTPAPALPRRGDGFFGEGFYIATDRVATGVGAERFGGRETPLARTRTSDDAVGVRLFSR